MRTAIALCILGICASASAAPPPLTTFQGRLSNGGGVVADGKFDLNVSLFAAPSGGAVLWSEAEFGVVVAGGAFSIVLGDASPLDANLLAGPGELWVEIAVDGEPPLPRTQLTSSPFALVSARLACTGCISPAHLAACGEGEGLRYESGKWVCTTVTGEAGAKGDQGVQGIQGIQGPEGPAGADGKDGADGAAGSDAAGSIYVHWGKKTCQSGWSAAYAGVMSVIANVDDGGRSPMGPVCLDKVISEDANGGFSAVVVQGRFNEPNTSSTRHDCAVCVKGKSQCYTHWGKSQCMAGYTEVVDGLVTALGSPSDPARELTQPVCAEIEITSDPNGGYGMAFAQAKFNEKQSNAAATTCAICCPE